MIQFVSRQVLEAGVHVKRIRGDQSVEMKH